MSPIKSLFLTAALALGTFAARAQPGSGGPAPGTLLAIDMPFVGRASLLLAGGLGHAARRQAARPA